MILDECRTLISRVAEKKQLRLNVEQLKRFQKIRDLFAQHVGRLTPLLAVLRTLRDAGIARIDLGDDARRVVALIGGTRDTFREKAESLIDERTFPSTPFKDTVDGIANRLEADLQSAWQKYTETKIPATNREVLDVLTTAFPREVRLLRQKADRLDLTRRTLPGSAQALREFDAEVADLQRAWGQLGGGEVPPPVVAFLKAAAAPSGARLDLLTDEVRRWLGDHGILTAFTIRAAT